MISGDDLGKIRIIWDVDEDLGRFRGLCGILRKIIRSMDGVW